MCSIKKNHNFNILIYLLFVIMIKFISCYNYSDNNNNNKSIIDEITWDCANNASCVNMMSKNVIKSYHNGESLNFGLFSLEKLQQKSPSSTNKYNNGRASSSITDFLQGNIIKFPVGPMVFSISRAEDDDDYIELALLKKSSSIQGRRNRDKPNRKDKKQMQMFIPMYLAATTFGWTLFAVKAVAMLTLKAFLVSKLAFLVSVAVIIKKFMDSASEKMLMPPPHQPYMMPYHMDYGMHGHAMAGSEISTNDFYNLHVPNHHQQPHGMENIAAESNLAHAIEIQANATQPQILAAIAAANAAAGGSQKIKRNDSQWTGVKSTNPMVYSYLPNQQQQVYMYRK